MDFHIQNIYEEKNKIVEKNHQNQPFLSPPNKEQPMKQQVQKQATENNKKIMTYDKILSSLNMQLVDGKLHIARKIEQPLKQSVKQVSFQNSPTLQNTTKPIVQKYTQQQMRTQEIHAQQQRMQMYHSQKQMNIEENVYEEEIPVFEEDPNYIPITKQEIKRRIALQYLKKLQEQRKIEFLKPKKMSFL